jgi:hypothetical protein
MTALALSFSTGFWRRTGAMLIKEFISCAAIACRSP